MLPDVPGGGAGPLVLGGDGPLVLGGGDGPLVLGGDGPVVGGSMEQKIERILNNWEQSLKI